MTAREQGSGKPKRVRKGQTRRFHSGRREGQRLGVPKPGLFRDIVLSPDRDSIPGARPMVSFRDDDEASYLTELQRRSRARYRLKRRGVDHGQVAELSPDGLVPTGVRRRRREAQARERWFAARPLLLTLASGELASLAGRSESLYRRLRAPEGLATWLADRLGAPFEVDGAQAELFDPERDLERVLVRHSAAQERDELWLKSGRLSTFPEDHSLRLRVSFGREGDDDDSRDERRQRLTAELGRALVPGFSLLEGWDELRETLTGFVGEPVFYAQPIGYWNAPQGGARFHHDAFHEPATPPSSPPEIENDSGSPRAGQRGVVFLQLSGRTLWLALSNQDLALRVREYVRWLSETDLSALRSELFPAPEAFKACEALAEDPRRALEEIARPDCGRFEPIVNRGADFTPLLVDAGHAVVLRPGEALVLPNHGPERTAMHSVFCASEELTYGLSVGIRADANP